MRLYKQPFFKRALVEIRVRFRESVKLQDRKYFSADWMCGHFNEGGRNRLGQSRVASRLQANNRGKTQLLGPVNDTGPVDQLRLSLPHDIPNVPVDAAAFRESICNGPHDVAMPVREKERAEELSGRRVAERQKVPSYQEARCAVGVGKRVNSATDFIEGLSLASLVDNDIGLIKRLMPIEWNREEFELVLVLYVRIVTDPSRIQLPGKQQRCNLLVGPSLQELNGSPKPLRQVRLEQRQ